MTGEGLMTGTFSAGDALPAPLARLLARHLAELAGDALPSLVGGLLVRRRVTLAPGSG